MPSGLEQDLRNLIAQRQVVVVVGSGVSIGATGNAPAASWTGLLKLGLARCRALDPTLDPPWEERVLGDIASGRQVDLLSAAEKVSSQLGGPDGPEFARWLRESVGALDLRAAAALEALRDLGLPLVTTNYDDLLERVTNLPPATWRDQNQVFRVLRGEERAILHVHGHWRQPDSVVLGIRSYEHVRPDAHEQAVIRALAMNHSPLLVGCGDTLTDPNFKPFLSWLRRVNARNEARHYRLALRSDVETLQAQHPREERIFVLPYGDDHSALAGFLRSLVATSNPPTLPQVTPAAAAPADLLTPAGRWKLYSLQVKPELLQELFLLKRETAVAKVNAVFDGQLKELCLRTVFPKQVPGFILACLAQRGELETGAGNRCLFVGDRAAWTELCRPDQASNQVLIADPRLDFDAGREELLPLARARGHAIIYTLVNPRPDRTDVVGLNEPKEYDVREVLKKHGVSAKETERLARQSNGNIYLLTCLLTGATGRPPWASDEAGYHLRCLALIGGWDAASALDREAVAEIVGEPYEVWVRRIYPLTKQEEAPVLLDGKAFKPVSRYEMWQQLAPFLIDEDLTRFSRAAVRVLQETAPELELPKEERHLADLRAKRKTHSRRLQEGVAETLALLGAMGHHLPTSPNLASDVAGEVVGYVLASADWKRWATLNSVAPQLAEAAPSQFLSALEQALFDLGQSPLKEVFAAQGDPLFGRSYHAGLLWSLEVLAWSADHLNRVAATLARLARFPLPQTMGNNPLATLRAIFLTWMPQTLASVEARKAAVECVIAEDQELGWKLLLEILPERHQASQYNQKPHWRDAWFPADWSEGVTRSEMYRQVKNYAELAVQLAMNDVAKLIELIARWEYLPKEVFQRVLEYLESPEARQRPEAERFALWQKLTNEVNLHRRYPEADWAMPEEELRCLDHAAQAIKPADPALIHQRLFNDYDHLFFTGSDYKAEAKKLAQVRTDAVAEILKANGAGYFLEMARAVKLPIELGSALGRIGGAELDQLVLPSLLEAEQPLVELMAGYVWARYDAATIKWARSVDVSQWTPAQIGIFFSRLPFTQDVWTLAEARLGESRAQYWSRVWPNPFQAEGHLLVATQKSLDNGRPDLAIACINAMRHLKERIPTTLATGTVKQLVTDAEAVKRLDPHELLEVIQGIQAAPDANEADVGWIELQCLPLLDRFSGARPEFLERRLANDAAFFHEVITACFRSERDLDKQIEPNPERKALAERTYRLLHDWGTPPGTTREKTMDEATFAKWFAEVRSLCESSGHWAIAQQMIGKTLMYAPAGLVEMLNLPVVARTLNSPEHDDVRRGLELELFNSRGSHWYTGGKDELNLAARFREHAKKYDLATYPRIAATLRNLAEGYEREAERDAKRDPLDD